MLRITATRWSGSNGFVTYSSAESSLARARSVSLDFAEHTTTQGRRLRPASSASTNQPSSTGIMMSSTTRAGLSSSMRRSAVSPSAASAGSKPSDSRIIRSVSSTSGSSSTMRTLGLPDMRDLPTLLLDGTGPQVHPEAGSAAGRVLDPHRSPTRLHEPAHDREPEAHPRLRPVRVRPVEALEHPLAHLRRHPVAAVDDRQDHLVIGRLHRDPH